MTTFRRSRPAWTLAVACLLCGYARSAQALADQSTRKDNRPNILFIFTDDQSHHTVSCYPEAWPGVKTPNIDRLAEEGMRFTFAYGGAWCAPSRATILTGLQPHGIDGLRFNSVSTRDGSHDPQSRPFWPAELRKSGYHTGVIGKWHVTFNCNEGTCGHGRDWDHSVIWDLTKGGKTWYNDPFLCIDGAPTKQVPGYATDLYTQYAVDYIKREHKKPWFLWLCYTASHTPITDYHPRHADQYKDLKVPMPTDIFGPRPGKAGYMQKFTMWEQDDNRFDGEPFNRKLPFQEWVRSYNRVVSALDEGVGKIVESLRETGQLDNTLIVYTSDQGFAVGEHGFSWKVGPYEACMRMPMIFRLPGRVAKGAVCDHPISVVDLPPTFLALAGVPLPWKMHGHDISPILENPKANWPHPVLLEHFHWQLGHQTDRAKPSKKSLRDLLGVPWWISLRQKQYKYIRTLVPDEIEELYDVKEDPAETRNLALEPGNRKLLDDYRQRMMAELRRTDAGLLKNLPEPKISN